MRQEVCHHGGWFFPGQLENKRSNLEAIGDFSMIDEVTIAGVMFVSSSRTFFVDSGEHQLAVGDRVLVQLEQDTVVGEVVIAPNQVVSSAYNGRLWQIVRIATPSDTEFLSEPSPSDETTTLLGGLGRNNKSFSFKTMTMDFLAATTWQTREPGDQANSERDACDKAICQNSERSSRISSYCSFPRLGQKVNTPEGAGIVKAINIFQEKVTVELEDGIAVELAVMQCSDLANEQH